MHIEDEQDRSQNQVEQPEDEVDMQDVHDAKSFAVEPPQVTYGLLANLDEIGVGVTVRESAAVIEDTDLVLLV